MLEQLFCLSQRPGQYQGRPTLLLAKICITRTHGQTVRLTHNGTDNNFHAKIQIPYHPPDDCHLRGIFPVQTATQGGLTNVLNTIYVFGLPKDYAETFRARIAAVTPEQVKSAASVLLGSQDSVIAIVGDYAKVKDQLAAFKDIKFFDPDGKSIQAPQ